MTADAEAPAGAGVTRLPVLPENAILVHVGTPKTGTTALQADLRRLRPELAAAGVTYPATSDAPHDAAQALIGGYPASGRRPTREERSRIWDRFAREVRSSQGRALISTEYLSQASDASAARLVRDLGPDRVHVIVAFRPLQTLLPSSWQQYLKNGNPTPYEEWLAAVLADPPDPATTPTFWKRNDIPAQVGRWGAQLGPARITCVIVDSLVDTKVRRSIEALLALPVGTIADTGAPAAANRSLTAAEAELVRRVNAEVGAAIPWDDYRDLVRFGVSRQLVESRVPAPDEPRLGLPGWAVERVRTIGAAHAAWLRSSGAHVVGDPDVLAEAVARDPLEVPDRVPMAAAEMAVVGAILAAVRRSQAPSAAVTSAGARPATGGRRLRLARRISRRLRPG